MANSARQHKTYTQYMYTVQNMLTCACSRSLGCVQFHLLANSSYHCVFG